MHSNLDKVALTSFGLEGFSGWFEEEVSVDGGQQGGVAVKQFHLCHSAKEVQRFRIEASQAVLDVLRVGGRAVEDV